MIWWEVSLAVALLTAVGLLAGWGWRGRLRLRLREEELANIDAEEHRMFDFLHRLGESIAQERSMAHLYRTIVEGVGEVLSSDGAALYLIAEEEFVPGHVSKDCPCLVSLPAQVQAKDEPTKRKWLRLGRVPREGEFLEKVVLQGVASRWRAGEIPLPEGVADFFGMPLWHGGKAFAVLCAVRRERAFSENDWDVFRSAAEQSAFGLGNALLHKEVQEKRRLDDELRLAQEVQRMLLPSENPDWPGYRVRGVNFAARLISGDYFDFMELPERGHGVIIADVSGKGVAAGLVMASCRSALRAHAVVGKSPLEMLSALNRQVFADAREDSFVSAAYAEFANDSGKVTLVRAGHDAPLLFRKETDTVEVIKPGGLALGIDRGPVFERVLKQIEFEMQSGDVLLFYTDGITEAENAKGEEFGKERLKERLAALATSGAEGVVNGLPAEVKEFAKALTQSDDITLVAIERL